MYKRTTAKDFLVIGLAMVVWLNASGLPRFFLLVIPESQSFLPGISNIAAVNANTLSVWAAWGAVQAGLYVFVFWLCANAFGNNSLTIVVSALTTWGFCFLLSWVAMSNMGFVSWGMAGIAIALTLIEALVASFIMSRMFASRANF